MVWFLPFWNHTSSSTSWANRLGIVRRKGTTERKICVLLVNRSINLILVELFFIHNNNDPNIKPYIKDVCYSSNKYAWHDADAVRTSQLMLMFRLISGHCTVSSSFSRADVTGKGGGGRVFNHKDIQRLSSQLCKERSGIPYKRCELAVYLLEKWARRWEIW